MAGKKINDPTIPKLSTLTGDEQLPLNNGGADATTDINAIKDYVGGGGALTFLELTDTPSDYTGSADYRLEVNQAGDAVNFIENELAGTGVTNGFISDEAQTLDGEKTFLKDVEVQHDLITSPLTDTERHIRIISDPGFSVRFGIGFNQESVNGSISQYLTIWDSFGGATKTNIAQITSASVIFATDLVSPTLTLINTPSTGTITDNILVRGSGGDVRQIVPSTLYQWQESGSDIWRATGNVGIQNTTPTEALDVGGNIKGSSFIKTGGASSEFLKADGSVSTEIPVSIIDATGTADNTTFLRGDGTWSIPDGIEEAPITNTVYGRKNGAWQSIADPLWTAIGSDIERIGGEVRIGNSEPQYPTTTFVVDADTDIDGFLDVTDGIRSRGSFNAGRDNPSFLQLVGSSEGRYGVSIVNIRPNLYNTGVSVGTSRQDSSPAFSVFSGVSTNVDGSLNNGTGTQLFSINSFSGNAVLSGEMTADKFIKSGGTSSQFLMADGSTTTAGPAGVPEAPIDGSTYGRNNGAWVSINSSTNYYLDGITKSGNTLTFSVNGTTDQDYTFGSLAFSSDTIPTNNNQLTNGAGYITSSSVNTLTNKSGNISQWTNNSGYITASSSNTLTNKSGNISQWTNDSGYLTNAGITGTGNGLTDNGSVASMGTPGTINSSSTNSTSSSSHTHNLDLSGFDENDINSAFVTIAASEGTLSWNVATNPNARTTLTSNTSITTTGHVSGNSGMLEITTGSNPVTITIQSSSGNSYVDSAANLSLQSNSIYMITMVDTLSNHLYNLAKYV